MPFAGTLTRYPRPGSLDDEQSIVFDTMIADINKSCLENLEWTGWKVSFKFRTRLGKRFGEVCDHVQRLCKLEGVDFHVKDLGEDQWEVSIIQSALPTQPVFNGKNGSHEPERPLALVALAG